VPPAFRSVDFCSNVSAEDCVSFAHTRIPVNETSLHLNLDVSRSRRLYRVYRPPLDQLFSLIQLLIRRFQ
jgi:hypothetical protein